MFFKREKIHDLGMFEGQHMLDTDGANSNKTHKFVIAI